ncbi:uncharacterized protein [Amphiura filiformis]|uniref:uncharacterized protein n=1 Tax=Amphiura filiformis TaxID=82378 RepID=UPI003B20D983
MEESIVSSALPEGTRELQDAIRVSIPPSCPPAVAQQIRPVVFNLDAEVKQRDLETQTSPSWDEFLSSFEKYLAQKIEALLAQEIKEKTCVHLQGLTLEKVLEIVVEHHNAICVVEKRRPDLRPGTRKTSQSEYILKRPAENTREELEQCGDKAIHCDPSAEMLQVGKKSRKSGLNKSVPSKQTCYQCEICGLKVNTITKLTAHTAKHTNLTPYPCQKCHRTFTTKARMRTHIKAKHNPLARFKITCRYCGKALKDIQTRNEHAKIVHLREKSHTCSLCSKRYVSRTTMVIHLKKKHGIGDFIKCPFCDCEHPSGHTLGTHLASMHKTQVPQLLLNITVHKCLICKKEFKYRNCLLKHVGKHGKPECTTCNYRGKRREKAIAEAISGGMEPEEAKAKGLDELVKWNKEWIKKAKEKRMVERAARHAAIITRRAIAQGLDPEYAQDLDRAKKWLMRGKEMEKAESAKSPSKRVDKMSVEELRLYQKNSERQEKQLKMEIVKLKKNIHKNAVDMALGIVGEGAADREVPGGSCGPQDKPVFRTKSEARRMRLVNRKSLTNDRGKKTIGAADTEVPGGSRGPHDKAVFRTKSEARLMRLLKRKSLIKDTGKKTTDLLSGQKRNVEQVCADDDECVEQVDMRNADLVKTIGAMNKIAIPRLSGRHEPEYRKLTGNKKQFKEAKMQHVNSDHSSKSPPSEDLTCTVYSQSPAVTHKMIKQDVVTFAVARSKSSQIIGTHMQSIPSSTTSSAFSQVIIINTNVPDLVKAKLTAGELKMNILPLAMKQDDIQVLPSNNKTTLAPSGTSKKKCQEGSSSHTTTRVKPKYKINQKGCQFAKLGLTCTVYSQSPELTVDLIKKKEIAYVVTQSKSNEIKGHHMRTVAPSPDDVANHKIVIYCNNTSEVQGTLDAGELNMIVQKPPDENPLVGQSGQTVQHLLYNRFSAELSSKTDEQENTLNVIQERSQGPTCVIYSQSPELTHEMIKNDEVEFVIARSESSEIIGTHTRTIPSKADSDFGTEIVINTNTPEVVRQKLLGGELDMQILPIPEDSLVRKGDEVSTKKSPFTVLPMKEKVFKELSRSNPSIKHVFSSVLGSAPQTGAVSQVDDSTEGKSKASETAPLDSEERKSETVDDDCVEIAIDDDCIELPEGSSVKSPTKR